jgi:hypothetical protein
VIAAWLLLRSRDDGPRSESLPIDGPAAGAPPPLAPPPLAAGGGPSTSRVEAVAGSGPSTGPTSRPSVAIVVGDEAGAPLPGATIYAKAKLAGGNESLREIGHADEKGRWPVPEKGLAGSWIVATAPGRVPAVFDGDRLEATSDTLARLAAGGVVQAIVTEADDRTPVAGATVYVAVAPTAGVETRASASDGPLTWELNSLVRASARTGDDGRAAVAMGATGGVRVEVRGPSVYAYSDPEYVALPQPSGTARFRLLAGCKLSIHAIDDATAAPFALPFEARLFVEGSDRIANGGYATSPNGVFDLPALRPGRYRLRVNSEGYEEWSGDPIVFEGPGLDAIVTARLKRATTVARRGTIRLTLAKPSKQGEPWYSEAGSSSATALLRRVEPDASEWGGTAARPPLGMSIDPHAIRTGPWVWDAARRVLEIPDIDPARYSVAVFDRSTWTVGGIAVLEVLPDATTERTVDLAPGVRVRIADLAGDAAAIRRLRLLDDFGTSWPLVDMGATWERTYDGDFGAPTGTVLLPVPAERVRATWRDAKGEEHEKMLPEAK